MSTDHLPPLLSQAYAALSEDDQGKYRANLQIELEAVSKLIVLARSRGITIPELDDANYYAGITVRGDKVCPCCMRPFEKKEP